MAETIIIKFEPALPCGILKATADDPEARCGRPATVAHANPAADVPTNMPPIIGMAQPGEWTILPVCRQCTQDMAKIYPVEEEK